jgi:hypothetical protein
MRYIVVIDKNSLIAQSLPATGHDGLTGGNPLFDCESIDTSHPVLLRLVRGPIATAHPKSRRVGLHIPYTALVWINEYADTERPVGFAKT